MTTYLDFETKSEVDLPKCGAYKYANHESTDIVCLAYKVDDQPTKLWTPTDKTIPADITYPIYAHNAYFDYLIWTAVGFKKYNFPLSYLDNWIDTAALCAYFTLPRSLGAAGKVLDLNIKKNPRGRVLIRKICMPPFEHTESELHEFYDYCIEDVDTMVDLINNLPATKLSKREQKLWELTGIMNLRGLPIDAKNLRRILEAIQKARPKINDRLVELTNGFITKVTQVKRIQEFINHAGCPLKNIQEKTVTEYLATGGHEYSIVNEILQLRMDYGSAAVAKFKKMNDYLSPDNRVRDYLVHYGASATGRWSGAGIQPQNMTREQSKSVDEDIANITTTDNPVKLAKGLVRSIIFAGKSKTLVAVDYSAIEYILALVIVRDEKHAALYNNNEDQYVDMAATLYKVPVDQVTKDQRMMGKVTLLQCQYQAGPVSFKKSALGFGLAIGDKEAKLTIDTYRRKYYLIVEAWWSLANAALNAVKRPGTAFTAAGCYDVKFLMLTDRNNRRWLTLQLPSGRHLFYAKPSHGMTKIKIPKDPTEPPVGEKYVTIEKEVVFCWSVNSTTHKWVKHGLAPGALFNNVIQGTARDVLADAKLKINDAGYNLLCSVHDEVIVEVDESKGKQALTDISGIMCEPVGYLPELKMRVDGWYGKRYRK